MRLLDFFRKKPAPAATYRLVWFELQIAPAAYRFAIMPQQPILIGLEGEAGQKGAVLLIRYDHAPEIYERTVEQIAALVTKHRVLSWQPPAAGQPFQPATMQTPGVHLRLAYADKAAWAGAYSLDGLPPTVGDFVQETQVLAREIMRNMPHQTIDGATAHQHLQPENNTGQKRSPGVVLKVKVTGMGVVLVDQQPVSLAGLDAALDDLMVKGGEVWYYREAAAADPSEPTHKVIKQVLDAIMARKLPIRLQEAEY